jgi:hypothetical protein
MCLVNYRTMPRVADKAYGWLSAKPNACLRVCVLLLYSSVMPLWNSDELKLQFILALNDGVS